jgi:hypothetical protein
MSFNFTYSTTGGNYYYGNVVDMTCGEIRWAAPATFEVHYPVEQIDEQIDEQKRKSIRTQRMVKEICRKQTIREVKRRRQTIVDSALT